MNTAPLGRSNIISSRIALGLAALGRPGYINLGHGKDLGGFYDIRQMENHTHAMLDKAWDLGIRHFDAARSYGKAESFLGSWLRKRQLKGQKPAISSKWGYTYTANWQVKANKHEVKEHSLHVLNRQWEETQSYLGTYLDLYQIHSATLKSGVLENQEVLKRLAAIRDMGVAIGLTLSGTGQAQTLEKAMEARLGGKPLFDTVQATYNMLETSVGPMLQQAHNGGMGVIIKEALANGRLTSRNQEEDFAWQRQILEEQAQRLNTSMDALAIRFILEKPFVDVVLSGATTTRQLEQNVAALDITWDNTATEALEKLGENPETYWNKRNNLPWN